MEDYIQGIVCGYLTVQNGTRDDAKRRRLFIVLSDSRMDYYATDPRPEFVEAIAESYVFVEKKTQVHHYAEMNARAPLHSFCLTTDKMTDVYIAESAAEAELWIVHLRERLEALHQMVVGALMMRKEIAVTQQVQRKLLQTKYTWRAKHVELGRSTLQFCSTAPQRRQKRAMNQFTLTAESYASEEPVEVLKSVAFAGFAVSSGALSASELKKLQKDPTLQAQLAKRGGGAVLGNGIVYPFVVCTGPAHLHLAAASEKEREEWIVAIKLRIIALKYRHNGRRASTDGASLAGVATDAARVRMHDFMEVQTVPGGPWERRYVELENEMLKVKLSDRTLGSKFETRVLPSCVLAPSLLKANAFVVQNRCQEIALAPGTLQDAQRWQRAILGVAQRVTLARSRAVFHDELAALLVHSVVYTVPVAGEASAGLVVEKHKKRAFVLSHTPPTAAEGEAKAKGKQPSVVVPEGSVLLGIAQDGMVHDSFETIWHRLRQKKGYHSHAMRLTFRAPMRKAGLVEVKHKPKARWALRRCVLRNGKLRVETALPSDDAAVASSSAEPAEGELPPDGVVLLEELALRHCRVELLPSETLGVRNTLKITVSPGGAHVPQQQGHHHHHHHTHRTLFLRVHHDGDLFVWFALLTLECAVAQDDPALPLALHTLQKRQLKASQGYAEDQRRQTRACRIAGQPLEDVELAAAAFETKLLQRARTEHQQQQRDDQLLLLAPESPVALGHVDVAAAALHGATTATRAALSDDDARQLFQHLDAIGCGKISTSAVAATLEALTRQLEPRDRDAVLVGARSALAKLVPASRQFVSITLEQTVGVLRNVSDPRVAELVRKFARHEIQCM